MTIAPSTRILRAMQPPPNEGKDLFFRVFSLLATTALLSACGGSNPFIDNNTDETPAEVETDDPSTSNSLFLFDQANGLTLNDVVFDPANGGELIINNLPFDGPTGRYTKLRDQGDAAVFRNVQTATTGVLDYYAVYVHRNDVQAFAAIGEDWADFGYGGANLKRTGFNLPQGVGEYIYTGKYAGLRKLQDSTAAHRLEIVTGDAEILLDVLDFDPQGNILGAITGSVTDRKRTTIGNTALIDLPRLNLKLVSFDGPTATFKDGIAGTVGLNGSDRDTGTFQGFFGGADGSEIAASIMVEGISEEQRVSFEVIDWTITENVTSIVNNIPVVTAVTRTGSVRGLNDTNREAVETSVQSGLAVGFLSAPTTDIPVGATTTITTETEIITGEGRAREIGVLVTEQQ